MIIGGDEVHNARIGLMYCEKYKINKKTAITVLQPSCLLL
jgi:hypothetical protein